MGLIIFIDIKVVFGTKNFISQLGIYLNFWNYNSKLPTLHVLVYKLNIIINPHQRDINFYLLKLHFAAGQKAILGK